MSDMEDSCDINDLRDRSDLRYINDPSDLNDSCDNLITINKGLLALGNDIDSHLCINKSYIIL